VLDRRITSLSERDATLLAEQLELEVNGAIAVAPSAIPSPRVRVAELLNGSAPDSLRGLRQGERMSAIIGERLAIRLAVETVSSQRVRAEIGVAAEVIGQHREHCAAIVRARVVALVALRATNREALAFKAEMTAAARVGLDWPADPSGRVFDDEWHGDSATAIFLESAVANGFVTAMEIR